MLRAATGCSRRYGDQRRWILGFGVTLLVLSPTLPGRAPSWPTDFCERSHGLELLVWGVCRNFPACRLFDSSDLVAGFAIAPSRSRSSQWPHVDPRVCGQLAQ